MWRGCHLERFNVTHNSHKARWLGLSIKEERCGNLIRKSALFPYTIAISQRRPGVSAGIATKLLAIKGKIKKPKMFMISFTDGSGRNETAAVSSPVVQVSKGATVTPDFAMDFFLNTGNVRRRRDTLGKVQLCDRHQLWSSVEDIGLQEYILYPKHLDIGRCSGQCLFPLTNPTEPKVHSVLLLMHHLAQPERVPSVCCVPSTFKSVQLLIRNSDDSVQLETFDDLIVDTCSCR